MRPAIIENVEKLRREYASRPAPAADTKVRVLVKPARRMWDRDITDFRLSNYARERLQNCGIIKVQDLYATNPKNEPGWYAFGSCSERSRRKYEECLVNLTVVHK